MSAIEITATGTAPLRRMIAQDGVPLTGATVRCDVRRSADGLVLDFADSTFKAVGVVGTRYRTLAAVDAVEWPGLYEGTALDLSTIVGGVTVGTVLTVTYYMTAPSALTLDQDSLAVVNWAVAGDAMTLASNAVTAAALAADAVTEIQAGLATSAALAAVATDATKSRRALWNRRALTSLGVFTLYADDAVTPLATASVTDKDGAAITLATGDAARTTALT